MASYFGPNATIGAGANCFCDAGVWAKTLEREMGSYLAYGTTFDGCTCAYKNAGEAQLQCMASEHCWRELGALKTPRGAAWYDNPP